MSEEEAKEENEGKQETEEQKADNLDGGIDKLEQQINKLEEDIETELETELSQITERMDKLKQGLSVAQKIENEMLELETELLKEKDEKEKYINRLHRLKADFSNYKKRMQREKEKIAHRAVKDFVVDLLPVIDNFERAIDNFDADNQTDLEGIKKIHKQLSNLLKKQGIETIDTVGEEFDPNLHEMMLEEENEEYESGVIVEELQKGYIYEEFVIRPAMVKVAK
ncbi:MAG: nucleotide exchange factor GrpE [Bacillota bacterium]